MSEYVVGVDGCPAGWIACRYTAERAPSEFRIFVAFAELAYEYSDAKYIAVDIPIGLRDDGNARRCDVEARVKLGPGRRSSVFPAPARRLLQETEYVVASQKSQKLSGKWMTKQQFYIMPKILEVDTYINPDRQHRIYEVHPEICFWFMAGHAMHYNKKTPAGYEERKTLLSKHIGVRFPEIGNWRAFWGLGGQDVSRDDVLDAAAAAWTAYRTAQGEARRLPQVPETDADCG